MRLHLRTIVLLPLRRPPPLVVLCPVSVFSRFFVLFSWLHPVRPVLHSSASNLSCSSFSFRFSSDLLLKYVSVGHALGGFGGDGLVFPGGSRLCGG